MKKNNKIILFGSKGFIASKFITLNKKYFIYSLDTNDLKPKNKKNYKFIKKNLLDKKTSTNYLNTKINASILTSYNINFKNMSEKRYLNENIKIIKNCLKICKKNKVKKIIYISSAAVYGIKNKVIKETDSLSPINIYGISKVKTEKMVMDYAKKENVQYIIFRIFNAYGYNKNNLITKFIDMDKNNIPLKINGDGNQFRDFIHIDDVISALNKSLSNKIKKNLILNLCTGKKIKMISVIKKLSKNFIKVKAIKEPKMILGSINNIRKELGWKSKINFDYGIKKIKSYYK